MKELNLTLDEAKRFILYKQGLLGEHRFSGKEGVLDFVRQAGCIQFDPIDVCGKNAELVLQSRVSGFTKKMLYELLYAVAIVFFCFFYTAMVFNPREIAENLKKNGAIITGIRSGEMTARHIDKVMTRLTLAGSLYMVFVCLVPQVLMNFFNVQFYFGGTSLLIIVVVIMDFMAQLESHMASYQYGDVLKKANLINYGR